MKLTKEVIAVLKYHGYTTHTCDPDVFMSRYDTVEEMGDAGFIGDRGALEFLHKVFDEDGVSVCGPIDTTEDVDVTPEDITSQDINEETTIEPVVVEPEVVNIEETLDSPSEPVVETESEKVEEPEPITETPTADEVAEVAKEVENTLEPESEPEKVSEVVENPKPKKSTAKKSTKKES